MSSGTSSIQVAVRCRPFTQDDRLGVELLQNEAEQGEVNLLNSSYSNTRYAFTHSWWSAYGYDRHAKSDLETARSMKLVDQLQVYESVGVKVKEDLLAGNAVVMFAYGLSGSGKTFTVFGPDAPDLVEAWYKHSEPHALWGIFPRLAYEIFKQKCDGWKITMKYIQNVVDTVRDLIHPAGKEAHYKSGLKKDADGFVDIEWAQSVVLHSWDDLRRAFAAANSRKAIAPTQFNHQSTRGHCIMTLEVEMPQPDNPGMKQRGRVYVCDLAGTEPAADVVHAVYERKELGDGGVEYVYQGPSEDMRKHKELQDQGKKINLSLSEMAQFFMKMAEAVKRDSLKPGASIPGCNSYFLCKFLKDTMLQARTYLFCAVRPEASFHRYTYATLGFAQNASVVTLRPKKAATIAATGAEKKLMAELEHMKKLVEQLQQENRRLVDSDGTVTSEKEVEQLKHMLEAKQEELRGVLDSGGVQGGNSPEEALLEQQRQEYGRRGISLANFCSNVTLPYFVNLDEDPFRTNRFLFIFEKEVTVFGPKGDVQPLSLSVVRKHCEVRMELDESRTQAKIGTVTLVAGKGESFHNGRKLMKADRVALQPYDRIIVGGELFLFRHVADPLDSEGQAPSADEAVAEYQRALTGGRGRRKSAELNALESQLNQLAVDAAVEGRDHSLQEDDKFARVMRIVDMDIHTLVPVVNEMKHICSLFARTALHFEISLRQPEDDLNGLTACVEVLDTESDSKSTLDIFDFNECYAILRNEVASMRAAVEIGRSYQVADMHDPSALLFNVTYHLGTSLIFTEPLLYFLETEDSERMVAMKGSQAPHDPVGRLEICWTPLESLDDGREHSDMWPPAIDSPQELLGKPWTYSLEIVRAVDLAVNCGSAYCQYEFLGETFTSETVETIDNRPEFSYQFTHHIDAVTPADIEHLSQPMKIRMYVSPAIPAPKQVISTENAEVLANFGAIVAPPKSPLASPRTPRLASPIIGCSSCESLRRENEMLRKQIKDLRDELAASKSRQPSIMRNKIEDAIAKAESISEVPKSCD